MKFLDSKTIRLDRELSELDKFVLNFIKILEKHVDYVIISGYVSILFGRARGTEDVDVFIRPINKNKVINLYKELIKKGYWCLNSDDEEEIYDYLTNGLAVRFAIKNETIPNFEVKFVNKIGIEALDNSITVIIKKGNLKISPIEMQIAFKRYYLKSDKDLEDARHLESIFKGKIDLNKIKEYKQIIENEA